MRRFEYPDIQANVPEERVITLVAPKGRFVYTDENLRIEWYVTIVALGWLYSCRLDFVFGEDGIPLFTEQIFESPTSVMAFIKRHIPEDDLKEVKILRIAEEIPSEKLVEIVESWKAEIHE